MGFECNKRLINLQTSNCDAVMKLGLNINFMKRSTKNNIIQAVVNKNTFYEIDFSVDN